MEKQKNFIQQFLSKEAECWTKEELGDLDAFNQAVRELYVMGTDDMDEAFGIFEKDKLVEDDDPMAYSPGYLFKISQYRNGDYGTLWVAYTSYKNPYGSINETRMTRGFILAEIADQLKIIGAMSVALSDLDMKPVAWEKSVYNPKDLSIYDLGEFVAAERYAVPQDDGFSLEDYRADK